MANTKSAAKRARRSVEQRGVNRHNKSMLKNAIKEARSVTAGASAEAIQKKLSETYSALDRAVYKGVLHKNAAARHKQRLTRLAQPRPKA
jgi:small subunit ribosomal protein S20